MGLESLFTVQMFSKPSKAMFQMDPLWYHLGRESSLGHMLGGQSSVDLVLHEDALEGWAVQLGFLSPESP